MNTFKQAAIEILKKAKKPLHCAEITRLALESGILETKGSNPEKTMAAIISVDIKNRKNLSNFVRVEPNIFSLNKNKESEGINKIIEIEKEQEEKILGEASFVGKAGEHLVCSELLFRNFNASIMSVDVGVDIAAVKDNKFFGIQVKTSQKNQNDIYNFHIRKKSFERFNKNNIFYVFVLKDIKNIDFLIFSSSEIERHVQKRSIFSVNNNSGYALSIKIRGSKIYLGNQKNEISSFKNK